MIIIIDAVSVAPGSGLRPSLLYGKGMKFWLRCFRALCGDIVKPVWKPVFSAIYDLCCRHGGQGTLTISLPRQKLLLCGPNFKDAFLRQHGLSCRDLCGRGLVLSRSTVFALWRVVCGKLIQAFFVVVVEMKNLQSLTQNHKLQTKHDYTRTCMCTPTHTRITGRRTDTDTSKG